MLDKRQPHQQMDIHMQNMETRLQSPSLYKNQFKMDQKV
jgi:hypothetical protein